MTMERGVRLLIGIPLLIVSGFYLFAFIAYIVGLMVCGVLQRNCNP